MLNLTQSSSVASHYQSRESIFNISNRAPPIPDDDHRFDLRDELHAALGRFGCAHVLLKHGHVVELSPAGRAILERFCGSAVVANSLSGAVRQIVKRAGVEIPTGSIAWLATSYREGIASLVNQTTSVWSDDTCAIVLLDLDARPEPSPRTLQRLFGLTAAEIHVAIELARGGNLLDIARSQRLSRTTIRSHLASLFVKTQTRRQVELVSLLGRIALLP
ncbi:helix-turn-helix transcriptional regulator [Bradyrhizobium manausense]|uniref:helix-turn-helix transcriptional regulator n=1 Tax=Bradyrhizobium manausense TaxID=989370 RepID=UPI001BADD7E6|nr:helix-turn-helix transcriptional regulator [Bradyrhizobium manausense]MBR0688295.1 helix-turn-helix transcriptional regulator [Bradyrhizobium manausense]MBR0722549.1 helix-turn-helix transcriptional regulator [Bradyrhizobium manausense]